MKPGPKALILDSLQLVGLSLSAGSDGQAEALARATNQQASFALTTEFVAKRAGSERASG